MVPFLRGGEIWKFGNKWFDWGQGPISRKPHKRFGPWKPFINLWPAYSVKLVFSYVVKGIKFKIIIAKFHASRCLCFEDTKRIMLPEMCLKRFWTFEKHPRVTTIRKLISTISLHQSKCGRTSAQNNVNSLILLKFFWSHTEFKESSGCVMGLQMLRIPYLSSQSDYMTIQQASLTICILPY